MSQTVESMIEQINELAGATNCFGWDREPDALFADPKDLGAKPIPKDLWNAAKVIGWGLTRDNSGLPWPTPGADPEGFVWLSWERDSMRFDLGLTKTGFKWVRRDTNGTRSEVSHTLRDAADALRASFPRPACLN